MSRILNLGFVLIATLGLPATLPAEKLNWDQHRELFMEGAITDKQGNTWRVKILPGAHRIDKSAVKGWKDAGKLIDDLWDSGFYSKQVYENGLRPGVRLAKASAVKFWFDGIQRDYATMRNDSGQLRSGDFGKTFFKVWSGVKFGLKVAGRTVVAPTGAALGVAYAVVAPVTLIASRPVGAGLSAAFPGATVPAILYVWNGAGWTATYFSSVPSRENVWVQLKSGGREFTIDAEGFKAILQGTAAAQLTQDQVKIIQDDMKDLNRKLREDSAEIQKLHANLQQQAASRAMHDVIVRARLAKSAKLEDASQALYMNDVDLRAIVRQYLAGLGVSSPTETQVDAIAESIRRTIGDLLRN